MAFIADTHVHLYPSYDLERAFEVAFRNLSAQANSIPGLEDIAKGLFLTERSDCNFFRLLSSEQSVGRFKVSATVASEALVIEDMTSTEELFLFAGRQILTRERLEVLALTAAVAIPDGLAFEEALQAALQTGAMVILPWSPGKWFLGRGELVETMLHRHACERLFVGDSALRPIGWPEPRLFAVARELGLRTLVGSDPLPFKGEEQLIASYRTISDSSFTGENPVVDARSALTSGKLSLAGFRSAPMTFARRYVTNMLEAK